MMPVVGRHEELAAMLRVVIAVRTRRDFSGHRRAVRARARLRRFGRGPGAGPRHGHRQLNQIAAVDGALSRLRLRDHRVHRAAPDRIEAHGHEVHLADRTDAFLVLEDVRVHRARPRQRRQAFALRTLCRGSRGREAGREREGEQKSRGSHHNSLMLYTQGRPQKGWDASPCRAPSWRSWTAPTTFYRGERRVR